MKLEATWSQIKSLIDDKTLLCTFAEFGNMYILEVSNGPFTVTSHINKVSPASSDQTDFEDNYKDVANRTLLC